MPKETRAVQSIQVNVPSAPLEDIFLVEGRGQDDLVSFLQELSGKHRKKAQALGVKIQTEKGVRAGAKAAEEGADLDQLPGRRLKDLVFNDDAGVSFYNSLEARTHVDTNEIAALFKNDPHGFLTAHGKTIAYKINRLANVIEAFAAIIRNTVSIL